MENGVQNFRRLGELVIGLSGSALHIGVVFFVLLLPSMASAQWTHVITESPELGIPVPTISVKTPMSCSNGSTTLPDGGFVKLVPSYPWTQITLDATATNKGACANYWRGVWDSTEQNGIRFIQLHNILPDGTGGGYENSTAYSYPWPAPMTYDTANPTNGAQGSFNGYFAFPGTYTMQFKNVSIGTSCAFPTDSAWAETTANVMQCKPTWFVNPSDTINYHAPLGDITIAIPTAFDEVRPAAEAAAQAWSNALQRTITVRPNTTCDASDPLCVGFKADHGTRPGDEGCASLDTASYNSDGEWIGSTAVRFIPNWSGANGDNYQRLIAHELGHYFGLFNRLDSSCVAADTIMGAYPGSNCYSSQPPPDGTLLGPSFSDALAIEKSTYGNRVRTTCGW